MKQSEKPEAAIRLEISGKVQGVGFRYAMLSAALRLGLKGWIRNRDDGSVEAVCEGLADMVQRFVVLARKGPPGAYVRDLRLQQLAPQGCFRSFTVEA